MNLLTQLAKKLSTLIPLSDNWNENAKSIAADGVINVEVLNALASICHLFEKENLDLPNIRFDDNFVSTSDIEEALNNNDFPHKWKFSLGKDRLAESSDSISIIPFISCDSFKTWTETLSPAQQSGCDFTKHILFLVNDIGVSFGGEGIAVFPIESPDDYAFPLQKLPKEESIRKVLHVISDQILLSPSAVSLTWGDVDSIYAAPFRKLSAQVMGLALGQDIYVRDNEIRVVIRGVRRIDARLGGALNFTSASLKKMKEAVEWVYSEREETRHKLLSDRLSLDINENNDFLVELETCVEHALKQAKERYGFVILDRKDAYHKELRDIMKDVRTQSDLFAAKVRDLVGNLLRDSLAVLFLVGISLVGRVKTDDISGLTAVPEVQMFFKVLSFYFFSSAALQIFSSFRDITLATQESRSWQELTREYVTLDTFNTYYNDPIQKRRMMFVITAFVCGFIYLALILISWNIKCFVEWLI